MIDYPLANFLLKFDFWLGLANFVIKIKLLININRLLAKISRIFGQTFGINNELWFGRGNVVPFDKVI